MYVFDFDGTIVDVWHRFYEVFCLCVGSRELSFDQYVIEKRRLRDDSLIADGIGRKLVSDFRELKAGCLEDLSYLRYDELLIDAKKLIEWFSEYPSIILTKRRIESHFRKELGWLGLEKLQNRSFVLSPQLCVSKGAWLKLELGKAGVCAVIGDTVEDMRAANDVDAKAIFVNTGLQDCNYVLSQTLIYDSYSDISKAIGALGAFDRSEV